MLILSVLLTVIYIPRTTGIVDEYDISGAVRGTYKRCNDLISSYTIRTPPLSAHLTTPLTTPRSTIGSSPRSRTARNPSRSPKSQSSNHNTIKYISTKEDYLLFVTTTNNKTKWEIYTNTVGTKLTNADKKYFIETQIGELPTSSSGWMNGGNKRSADIKRAPSITLSRFQMKVNELKDKEQECETLQARLEHNRQVINATELELARKIAENAGLNSLIIKHRDELQGKIDNLTLLLNVQGQEFNVTQKELDRIIMENQAMVRLMVKERKIAQERINNLTLLVEEQTRKISEYQKILDRRMDGIEEMDLLSLLVNKTRKLTEYEEEMNMLRIGGELVNVRRRSEVDIGYNQTTEDDRNLMESWNGLNVGWKITLSTIVIGDLCLIILAIYCCRIRELKERTVMMENIHQMKKLELMQLHEILNAEKSINTSLTEANKSDKLFSDGSRDSIIEKDVLVENIMERARNTSRNK